MFHDDLVASCQGRYIMTSRSQPHLENIETKHADELIISAADEEQTLLPDVRTATELRQYRL